MSLEFVEKKNVSGVCKWVFRIVDAYDDETDRMMFFDERAIESVLDFNDFGLFHFFCWYYQTILLE